MLYLLATWATSWVQFIKSHLCIIILWGSSWSAYLVHFHCIGDKHGTTGLHLWISVSSLRTAPCVSSCSLTWWSRTATTPGGSIWRPSRLILTISWASPAFMPPMRDLHYSWVEPVLIISGIATPEILLSVCLLKSSASYYGITQKATCNS